MSHQPFSKNKDSLVHETATISDKINSFSIIDWMSRNLHKNWGNPYYEYIIHSCVSLLVVTHWKAQLQSIDIPKILIFIGKMNRSFNCGNWRLQQFAGDECLNFLITKLVATHKNAGSVKGIKSESYLRPISQRNSSWRKLKVNPLHPISK